MTASSYRYKVKYTRKDMEVLIGSDLKVYNESAERMQELIDKVEQVTIE